MESEKISLANFVPPVSTIVMGSVNNISFQIKSDIPYEELLTHIQWALLLITDSNGYVSEPVKIACQELVLCAAFTNLDFRRLELSTIEQSELYEMYDIIKKTGIVDEVKKNINSEQLHFYETTLTETLKSVMNYRNSIAGIVELLSTQSEELKQHFNGVLEDFNDPAKTENVIKVAELMKNQMIQK